MVASFVLSSSKSSTYPRGYASGFGSPAALLDGHFEHPASRSFGMTMTIRKISVIRAEAEFFEAC